MVKPGKKPKEKKAPTNGESAPETVAASNSSVFDSIFGGAQEENVATASMFSDNNPFRRKPGGYTQEPVDKKQDLGSGSESPNVKRKRNNEGGDGGDEATPSEEEDGGMKKLKRGKSLDGRNETRAEKKKKRKRDEVEAEYEAMKYGVVAEEEQVKVVGRKRKTMDSLKDIVVEPKESIDDENKLLRTVFVGNLPVKIKKKELIKEFGKFGAVESVRIRSVPLNNVTVPRNVAILQNEINVAVDSVHAYVVFTTEESAQASLDYNMAVVGGHHIRVDRACPPRKKRKEDDNLVYDNKRTVFVGNLPFDVKDEELYQLFNSIKELESSIEAIRIVRDPGTSLGKGIAYILFKSRDAANLVVRKRQLKLRDRDLRLSHAKALTPPSKIQNPLPEEANHPAAIRIALKSKSVDPNSKIKLKESRIYQGLRASKSGIEKKRRTVVKLNMDDKKARPRKERSHKRPAVAARKAKVLKEKQTGVKRKLEKRTPDTIGQKKKARKFK
ncbi:OLC1v1031235C1 [Oldenlandia corymbosa var. corymbosa]|uniref:OLC1v1031235C1 n=1 Tax=Oldenlandia corymbosa var. corymbosa TaxID=529605 RepID=A0AAV1CHX9_OLDCO|nr:OLC1v1031235C1 [Oldenlandia corymbosa var. corymbosa]